MAASNALSLVIAVAVAVAVLAERAPRACDAAAAVLSLSAGGGGGGGGGGEQLDKIETCDAYASVLSDLRAAPPPSLSGSGGESDSYDDKVSAAAADFSEAVPDADSLGGRRRDERGWEAYRFLSALSSSAAFAREYWHRRPLLIRSPDAGGWADGAFTVERDLKLVGGSYISGHRTADALRDGTKTDTWDFRPLKDDAARKTTWEDVERSLRSPTSGVGTVYFNTAGSLWPSLGALCRLTGYAFGLPTNVNVYVTPPGAATSVPPHTDRQDVLAFQTQGAKRWRVYAPPPRRRGADPLHRGKGGDVLGFEEMGEPLMDAVLRRGDVLYVPAGFPHTTDTATATATVDENENDNGGEEGVFDETSVHLTMGLDTHVWGLTYAHMRWSALQRAGKPYQISIQQDDAYWDSLETIPCGFLAGLGWRERRRQTTTTTDAAAAATAWDEEVRNRAVLELKRVMVRLEPQRWRGARVRAANGEDDNDKGAIAEDEDHDEGKEAEELPSDKELGRVVDYMLHEHLGALMQLQEEMFSDIDPHSEETLLKAYRCTQEQNKIMERFGKFSKNEAMRRSFEAKRLQREAMTKGAL